MSGHTKTGNCWLHTVVYRCRKAGCRAGELCDVCHWHDEPRGSCPQCGRCEPCDMEQSETVGKRGGR